MSTFASALHKPGQKIVPRAAPRRNVQRHSQKPTTPAVLSIDTPESAHDSPHEPVISYERSNERAVLHGGSLDTLLPTPPATTVDQLTPPQEPSIEPIQIQTREYDQIVPHVMVEKPKEGIRSNLRSQAVAGNSYGSDDDTQDQRTRPAATEITASKRRKTGTQGAPSYFPSRSQNSSRSEAAPTTSMVATAASSSHSAHQRTSPITKSASSEVQDLLQRSKRGLSTVSDISRSIDDQARRSLRSRSRQHSVGPSTLHNKSQTSSITLLADAIVSRDSEPRNGKRARKVRSPQDPELHQIDPDSVMMGDLTRDTGFGQRSEIGKRLEADWVEIKTRWDAKAEENRQNALNKRAKEKAAKSKSTIPEEIEIAALAPRMDIVNGQLVVVQESREYDPHANMEARVEQGAEVAQEDEPIYRYVNQNRVGKKAGKAGYQSRWGKENTELFYKGLRMFGTDFEMIAQMLFPGRTRKEVKDKFVREERTNHSKIIEATRKREKVDLGECAGVSEMGELKDPDTVMKEIEQDAERLRHEFEEAKRLQEGVAITEDEGEEGYEEQQNDADMPLPSIELDAVGVEEDHREETPIEALASRTVESFGARPKPRKVRQPRASTRDISKAKTSRKGRKPLEGVEERIGTLDEIER